MPQPQLRWLMSHKSDNYIAAWHFISSNSSKAINSVVFQLFLIISMRQNVMNNSVTCPFPFFQVQFRIQPTKIRRSIWGHAAPLKVSSKDVSTVQLSIHFFAIYILHHLVSVDHSHENKEKSECHLQRSKTKLVVWISLCLVCSSCAGWYKNGQSINTCCFMGFLVLLDWDLVLRVLCSV